MKPDDIDEPLHSEDASFHHCDDTDSVGESAASIASKTLLQHGVDDEPARLGSLEEATRNEKRQEIRKTARTESSSLSSVVHSMDERSLLPRRQTPRLQTSPSRTTVLTLPRGLFPRQAIEVKPKPNRSKSGRTRATHNCSKG